LKLCSIADPDAPRARLCVIGDSGDLLPVGDDEPVGDVSELIARWGGTLEEAVDAAGTSTSVVGTYEDLVASEPSSGVAHLATPVVPAEVWAAGVTYSRSREARMLESSEKDLYDRVYEAARPELFFKATGARVVGPGAPIGLRSDSKWQVPEPEIALVLGNDASIVGYTLGNDMSSRDIEGDNPLYLPQAKIFAGSCSLGPTVVSAAEIEDPYAFGIEMRILREDELVFDESTSTARLHTRLDVLTTHLLRDNWLAPGTVLLTGTGIVPPDDFSLRPGDFVEISSGPIGVLRNRCEPAEELAPPAGWFH
jgi:2-dehydro-3-deoxy-D-arabinonate dehydratase